MEIIVLLIVGAFICGFIDSSLGMMYGTILSPALIISGFDPIVVVPAILFSQAIGGSVAGAFHHKLKNADFSLKSKNPKTIIKKIKKLGWLESFKKGTTKDFKIVSAVSIFGIVATIFSVLIAVNLSKDFLKIYIGILVIFMGVILLLKPAFKFSWGKIGIISIISAFNKGLSGGGFGPVITSGQIIAGRSAKSSIGATAFAKVPICIIGFLAYMITRGISDWNLVFSLSIGAALAAPFGSKLTASFKSEQKIKFSLGILSIIAGTWILIKTGLI